MTAYRKPRPAASSMTLTEKILLQHALDWDRDQVCSGDTLSVAVDWTLASEIAWQGMNQTYEALGRPPLSNPERFYLALDHTVDPGTLANDRRTQKLVTLSRRFAREAGLRYFYDANVTIMHTEFYRQLVRPGEVVVGADSHTTSHGGMGAFAIGLGGADVVAAMVQGRTWIQVPEAIRVHYGGRLPFGLTGKDVILRTLGRLGRNTVALERTVEYTGDHLEDLSTDFRFTIANMTAELGGLNGIFTPDGSTLQTMGERGDPQLRTGGWWLRADPGAAYAETFRIDLEGLGPQVAEPYSPDNLHAVEEVAGHPLDGCFIGACTTSEEELVLAALVLEAALAGGAAPEASDRRLVVPGSLQITERLRRLGLLDVYRQAGFRIGEPGCSMCIGIASDRAQPGEVWLSSQNRNFPNRMGKGSIAWLASALTVAASALSLRITDPRPLIAALDRERVARLLAPRQGLPGTIYREPTVTKTTRAATAMDNGHELPAVRGRVQCFGDHVDTDAMIAAEFCHLTHLDELGARAFLHYREDFTERVRRGQNILVAGEGWGTGSSREQAVWALKGAGVRAIVAKSFAFIHKRNLINESMAFVALEDPDFYQRAGDGDEIVVEPSRGEVTLRGKTYRGTPLAGPMVAIMKAAGLVPHIQSAAVQEAAS